MEAEFVEFAFQRPELRSQRYLKSTRGGWDVLWVPQGSLCFRAVLVNTPLQHYVGQSLDWQTGMVLALFKNGDQRVYVGVLQGESGQLLNLRFKRNNVGSFLAIEHWMSSIPLLGNWRGLSGFPNRYTCILRTWKWHLTMSLWVFCWRLSNRLRYWVC